MWEIILAVLIGGIIGGDFTYAAITKHRLKQWESHIERDADGIRQECQEFTVGNGDTALLMVHGFGDSPALYKNFAPALAEIGFTCRVIRLPGFAQPMPEYARTNLQLWLKALDDEIHQLKRNHNHIWIVAHSLGGAITIRYLLENTQGADGVILLAPLIEVSNHRSPLLSAKTWYEIGNRCLFMTKTLENYLPIDAHDPEVKKNHAIYCDRFIPRTVYNELFKLLSSLKGKADEFKLPLLMILALNDEVIECKTAERFYQNSSSTHKQLLVLENSGHVIPLDYEWKEAVSAISAFIRSNCPITCGHL